MELESNHLHKTSSIKNIHHQQFQEVMTKNQHNHKQNFKMKQQSQDQQSGMTTTFSLLTPSLTLEVKDKNKENKEIIDGDFKLSPKSMLSPITTSDIYENRIKPGYSINYQQSVSSPQTKSVSPPVATTTVTAQRRRDLKLKAEQLSHEQIELSKASLRQGDEVAL